MTPAVGERARARAAARRLDELRAIAGHARQRYDLYKARTYGPRATSPVRLSELEREANRTQEALAFALSEAKREAGEQASDQGPGQPPDQGAEQPSDQGAERP